MTQRRPPGETGQGEELRSLHAAREPYTRREKLTRGGRTLYPAGEAYDPREKLSRGV